MRDYSRAFPWPQLVLFKATDALTRLLNLPWLRRARTLRAFAYTVPPRHLSVYGGEYRFTYPINGWPRRFALRRGTSDVDVFLQVIRDTEYVDVARMLAAGGRSPRIIDAGANVGLATLYFKSILPEARVVALEPEASSFRMLGRCVADNALEHVVCLNAGIWTSDTHLAPDCSFRDRQSWSFALKEPSASDEGTIPVTSLDTLLSRAGWDRADLLKLDIEGGEARLMRDDAFLGAVQQRVGILCMEVHDERISLSDVQDALTAIGMTSLRSGGTLVGWREAQSGR